MAVIAQISFVALAVERTVFGSISRILSRSAVRLRFGDQRWALQSPVQILKLHLVSVGDSSQSSILRFLLKSLPHHLEDRSILSCST